MQNATSSRLGPIGTRPVLSYNCDKRKIKMKLTIQSYFRILVAVYRINRELTIKYTAYSIYPRVKIFVSILFFKYKEKPDNC